MLDLNKTSNNTIHAFLLHMLMLNNTETNILTKVYSIIIALLNILPPVWSSLVSLTCVLIKIIGKHIVLVMVAQKKY